MDPEVLAGLHASLGSRPEIVVGVVVVMASPWAGSWSRPPYYGDGRSSGVSMSFSVAAVGIVRAPRRLLDDRGVQRAGERPEPPLPAAEELPTAALRAPSTQGHRKWQRVAVVGEDRGIGARRDEIQHALEDGGDQTRHVSRDDDQSLDRRVELGQAGRETGKRALERDGIRASRTPGGTGGSCRARRRRRCRSQRRGRHRWRGRAAAGRRRLGELVAPEP